MKQTNRKIKLRDGQSQTIPELKNGLMLDEISAHLQLLLDSSSVLPFR